MKINELFEDGVITAYNTTVDVKPGETERQAKKFFGGNGKPLPLGAKGATPNQAFNLGLTENMSVTGTERRRLEKKKGIEVGTPEWFKHWFDLPYLREDITKKELLAKLKDEQRGRYIQAMLDTMHKLVQSKGDRHSIGSYAFEVAKSFGFSPKTLEKMYRDVYNMPLDSMVRTEDVTQGELNALERVIDNVFSRIGIDVEFTRHFIDRANDDRNGKPITIQELGRLFAKEYKRWGKPIAQLGPDAEAVMKDLESDINIPFALRWNGKELELIAKTVMRKKNFRTSNKQFPVENTQGSLAQKINWGGQNKPTAPKQQDMSWWQKLQNFADGKKKVQESMNNPYPYTWELEQEDYQVAAAPLPNDSGLDVTFDNTDNNWFIDFSVDFSQDKTGAGDEFRIFATVVAVIKDWWKNKFDKKADSIVWSGSKREEEGNSRVKLYKRFAQQMASQTGWKLEITDGGSADLFKLSNPNPTPRDDDSDNNVEENFADGKNPGRKGLSKRVGIPSNSTLAQLEKIAKNSDGEKRRLAQWQLNMRRGKNK